MSKKLFLDVCFIIPVNFEDSLQNEERAGKQTQVIFDILRQWSIKITVRAAYFVISQSENRENNGPRSVTFYYFWVLELQYKGPNCSWIGFIFF